MKHEDLEKPYMIKAAIESGLIEIARAEVVHLKAMRMARRTIVESELDVQTRSEVVDHPNGVVVIIKQTYFKEDVVTISVGIAVRVWIKDRTAIEVSLGEGWRDHISRFVIVLYDKLCRETAGKVMDIVGVEEDKPEVKFGLYPVKDEG